MKRISLLIVVLLLLAVLFAQSGLKKNSISGTVFGENGKLVPKAKIEAYLDNQRVEQTKTDLKGWFMFLNLEQGSYRIDVTAKGYEPYYVELELGEGAPEVLSIQLTPTPRKVKPQIAPKPPKEKTPHKRDSQTATAIGNATYETVDGRAAYSAGYASGMGGYVSLDESYPPFNTEDYSSINQNIYHSPLTEPLSTFSIDVDTATYSNVRRMLNNSELPPPNMIRIEEMVNYFDYDYPKPKDERPFSVYTELGVCPWNNDHQIVHIGLQGKTLDMSTAVPSNLVFLIDVSGSMEAENKLGLVQRSLNLLVDNMRAEDRIAIVVYASSTGLVLPSTPGSEKATIKEAINRLTAGGSTAGGAGIQLAYQTAEGNLIKEGNNRVILCTDGDFNIGPSSDAAMEELIVGERNKGIFLTVLGYGMGNYKDNKMETLADKGNGNYAYIDTILEAQKVLVNEMSSTLYTIAKDVKIQAEFNPAHVRGYRLIGYENRLLRTEDFKDDKKDAGELGAGHTVTVLYEIIPITSQEKVAELDSLKYQQIKIPEGAKASPEIMTIKLRYKLPDSDTSVPMETPVYNKVLDIKETSDRFRFSASVVGYGMMLQGSEFKGKLDWKMVRELANGSIGEDKYGYRKEFLSLIEKAALLQK